ncbi:hypothetical protein K461DRAFT_322652 [Myriangium duriaei CBS 260.36]|uniref:Fucose-specific lectin n=1 Tax=Myriangium duriaei CBS 260.36 TaxID=1168546 RepID=A0A9P4J2V9_9PEZI|nr:hypothetical protein K461DRAFT_322652 [Myriangium duriaei CBS 260.36]
MSSAIASMSDASFKSREGSQHENFPIAVETGKQWPGYEDPGLHPHEYHHEKIPASNPEDHAPEAVPHAAYYARHPPEVVYPGQTQDAPPAAAPQATQRRGRRKLAIILGAIIVLLVIVAAVLGGVLGSRARKDSASSNAPASANSTSPTNSATPSGSASGSSPSSSANPSSSSNSSSPSNSSTTSINPIQAIGKTGLASAASADGTGMLTYYQTSNGSVFEDFYPNNVLNSTESAYQAQGSQMLPITNVMQGSPLAAVTYVNQGAVTRHLFYVISSGSIMHTFSTAASTSWSSPGLISSDDTLFPGSPALCANAFTNSTGFKGVRVYFANANGGFNEYRWDQGSSDITKTWWRGKQYSNVNPNTGCASSMNTNGGTGTWTHVWFQNATSSNIAHYFLANDGEIVSWKSDLTPNAALKTGSSMAVSVDRSGQKQYLFFQGAQDSNLRMFSLSTDPTTDVPTAPMYTFDQLGQSRLAAIAVNSSAQVVLFQDGAGELKAQSVSTQGNVLANATLAQ